MPEREVAVCSTDEARKSCPELRIFFLLASHGVLLHGMCTSVYTSFMDWVFGHITDEVKSWLQREGERKEGGEGHIDSG